MTYNKHGTARVPFNNVLLLLRKPSDNCFCLSDKTARMILRPTGYRQIRPTQSML